MTLRRRWLYFKRGINFRVCQHKGKLLPYTIAPCQIGSDRCGRPRSSKVRDYFLRKISEGKTEKEALTCLQRRLCDIIYAMMKNKTEYRFERSVSTGA